MGIANMPQSTSHWKTLASSMKKTVKACIGELHTLIARLELDCESSDDSDSDESGSESDSESDSECSSEDECDGDSCSPKREKRKYQPGPRAKGYKLFIAQGGSREQWSEKSDKYKDRYYERNKDNM